MIDLPNILLFRICREFARFLATWEILPLLKLNNTSSPPNSGTNTSLTLMQASHVPLHNKELVKLYIVSLYPALNVAQKWERVPNCKKSGETHARDIGRDVSQVSCRLSSTNESFPELVSAF